MKNKAIDRLSRGFLEAVELYTDTALLLNSCDIAKKRYENIYEPDYLISTTYNVPQEYKFFMEFDRTFYPFQLVEEYAGPLVNVLSLNYLVRAVSLFDACLEDVYETLLPLYDVSLTVDKVSKRVRSAWTENPNTRKSQLRSFFTDDLHLQSPKSNQQHTPDVLFDRYEELREIRHAVVHNEGVLAKKHKDKLKLLSERLPEELRQFSLANADFIATDRVNLSVPQIYMIRKWLFEAIRYLILSFKES